MLIIDEAKAKQLAKATAIERTREITLAGARNDARDVSWVEDKRTSVANVERQTGRKFSPEQFMSKLGLLNKDIILKPHPGFMVPKHVSRDKACLYLNVGGVEQYLFVCEGDWMPEWSIMKTRKVKIPDVTRPDAAWKTVDGPRYVEKRGWREVLIKLIQKGLIGLDATERIFGAGDRPSWKILTGKGFVNNGSPY